MLSSLKNLILALFGSALLVSADTRPNVLFIAIDDLNDWVGHLGGHPQSKTPNIDRLAREGVSFARAYCSAPLCNPSRVSLLTGIEPSKSGVYGNGERFRQKLPKAVTLMQYFRTYGYAVKGGGKIFHGANRPGDLDSWDFYFKAPRTKHEYKRPANLPASAWAPWGPLDNDDSEMFDSNVVSWAISELEKTHDKPFFLACGFTKPHLPWHVPRKYFDLHPLSKIVLPETLINDREDLPVFGKKLAQEVYDVSGPRNFAKHGEDHDMVLKYNQWYRAVQSYLATISFVDFHVGRLLKALKNSEHAGNTIIVLWGDHGWHLGEKQHWRKHALWETTTRTTLIVSAPEQFQKNQLCQSPVSLIDLYPTIVELCSLPARNGLDGQSIVPLLQNPKRKWNRPVLTTFGKGNHAVRTERWRYIRYHDGGEELYDHDTDPQEWTNLAKLSRHSLVIERLRKSIPK
ncbi:MAG: sulfatase [Verrucomicrobiota bacterium]|jgi:arylsulfatase A-like enzyme|nr:sulfatase [Verrucomicrobiota bacterium]